MNISKEKDGSTLTLKLSGRLETTTAPEFERESKLSMDGIDTLIIDMEELEYVSSAGLRVILTNEKAMRKQGKMILRHPNETVMKVFEITGFAEILNIER